MTLALAAYNAGMANVDSWVANTPSNRPLRIPAAFAETRAYLDGVEHARSVYRAPLPRRARPRRERSAIS